MRVSRPQQEEVAVSMQIPDRDQQIVQAHAAFICQAVEFIQRPGAESELDSLLKAAADNGWTALADAVRGLAGGQRNIARIQSLDDENAEVREIAQEALDTLPG